MHLWTSQRAGPPWPHRWRFVLASSSPPTIAVAWVCWPSKVVVCGAVRSCACQGWVWAELKQVVVLSGADGRRLMGPGLWGTSPDMAADIISKQMHVILPQDSMGVHAASYVPSYSSARWGPAQAHWSTSADRLWWSGAAGNHNYMPNYMPIIASRWNRCSGYSSISWCHLYWDAYSSLSRRAFHTPSVSNNTRDNKARTILSTPRPTRVTVAAFDQGPRYLGWWTYGFL